MSNQGGNSKVLENFRIEILHISLSWQIASKISVAWDIVPMGFTGDSAILKNRIELIGKQGNSPTLLDAKSRGFIAWKSQH